jgi:predicted nucleotidyltransferase component of viral defense system
MGRISQLLEGTQPRCYSLREILAEKLRAVVGQRRFAISRDVYDIHHLVQSGVSPTDVVSGLPVKFAARGVEISVFKVEQLIARRVQFEEDWQRRLHYLVQDASAVPFAVAWQTTIEAANLVQIALSA